MRALRCAAALVAFGIAAAVPARGIAAAEAGAPTPKPAAWEVTHVEAPREIGLGTMAVRMWARVARKGPDPAPACVLVLTDDGGRETHVDMAPVEGAPGGAAEVVATIDTYTWVREGSHAWRIQAVAPSGPPAVLARGAIRVKPRVATPDLVLVDARGIVRPWVGSGAGGFTPGDAFDAGPPGGPPMVVDIDGDRLLDLAVPTRDGHVQLLENRGNGRLEPGRDIEGVVDLAACAVGDVDGDGRPDLVTASATGGLEIRLDLADDPAASVALPLAPDCLEVADLDGNGVGEIYAGLVGLADGEVHVVRRAGAEWEVAGSLSPPEGGRGRVRRLLRIPAVRGRADDLLVLSARDEEGTLESWGRGADTGTVPGLRTGVRLAGEPIGLTCGRFLGPGAPPVRIVLVREGRGADLIAIGEDDVPRRVGWIDEAPDAVAPLDLDGDGDDDLATAADDLRLWINVGGTEFREAGESPYLLESPGIALASGSLDERAPARDASGP
jgi:hypothetical protein